jgi:hypothetical protein
MDCLSILALSGFFVTLYAIKIKKNPEKTKIVSHNKNHRIRYTKILTISLQIIRFLLKLKDSYWLKFLDTYLGLLFYLFVFICAHIHIPNQKIFLLFVSSLSSIVSFVLATLLYFILHDFCIICITTYIINIGIFYCAYKELNNL